MKNKLKSYRNIIKIILECNEHKNESINSLLSDASRIYKPSKACAPFLLD